MNKKEFENIKNTLEMAFTGAKMEDDIELQSRLSRAIIAFESNPEEDIFLDNVIERTLTLEISVWTIIDRLNKTYNTNFSLRKAEVLNFMLKEGTTLVMEDTLFAIKSYLHGIEYGLLRNTGEKSSSVLNFLKSKVGGTINVKVSKVSKDIYFSQEVRHFIIKIIDVTKHIVTYQAETYNVCPSGLKVGNTTCGTPVLRISVPDDLEFEDFENCVLRQMVIDIDDEVKKELRREKKMKIRNYINSDMIINVTEEDMKTFGWTNDGLKTVSFTLNYIL